jgi:hypothetical protein
VSAAAVVAAVLWAMLVMPMRLKAAVLAVTQRFRSYALQSCPVRPLLLDLLVLLA